jgi:hypothetical protein
MSVGNMIEIPARAGIQSTRECWIPVYTGIANERVVLSVKTDADPCAISEETGQGYGSA